MESWLPWLTEGEHTLFDLLDDSAQVLLVEPRRMRDRAADILAEEADLAAHPGRDLGRRRRPASFPPLHLPFDRLLATTEAPAWTITDRARGTRRGHRGGRRAGRPVVGDGTALVRQLTDLLADGYRVVVAADGAGTAARLLALLGDEGVHLARRRRHRPTSPRRAARSWCSRSSGASCCRR